MGQSYEFRCIRCGYAANVSGNTDAGLLVLIQTMICKTCSEVVDVVTGSSPGNQESTGELDERVNKCPNCGSGNLQRWTNRKCPKCGGRMKRGDLVTLWD
jgi:DNA-directed RNA polymerase subunit RPC12/RpoP